MAKHSKLPFDDFMSQLQETNKTLDFFCDFAKIKKNVNDIKISLHTLNSLLNADDIDTMVKSIWERDKSAFSVMNILLAVRDGGEKINTADGQCIRMDAMFTSPENVVAFLHDSGLRELFEQHEICNLVDYVFGVETGLDTNARKNRSGTKMESNVARIFEENHITFLSQVSSTKWATIQNALGKDTKIFDFVIETQEVTYLIETNFYGPGGGSKLNEVARSYSDIAPKINAAAGFEFVWITDGQGWKSAKNKLQEAYGIIPKVYNLRDINDFIDEITQPPYL